MKKLGYQIHRGVLGRMELRLFDLDHRIPNPTSSETPPYHLVECLPIISSAQGVLSAHRRGAVPVPEKE